MHGAIPNSLHRVDPETVKPGDVRGNAEGKFYKHQAFLHPDSPLN
jgi:hypothetical protein